MSSVAGHFFVDGPGGERCSLCGKTWLAVLADREFWQVGQSGIAERGDLNEREVNELNAKVERIWQAVSGRVPLPEPEPEQIGYAGFFGMIGLSGDDWVEF